MKCSSEDKEMATPFSSGRGDPRAKLVDLKGRLEKCWKPSLDGNLYPEHIKKASYHVNYFANITGP